MENQLEIKTTTNMLNISQLERDSEDFQQVMFYTRAILSFSLIAIFLKDIWATLMLTLGISTQVYEKDRDEIERINRQNERNEENIRNAYERQRYREWLRGHSK